jgi:hypothetical protein
MSEPTLQQVFGANVSQTATQLVITKADLAAVGLTPSATNTAESLVVALLLLAGSYLNDTNQDTNPDIQVTINQGTTPSIISRNNAIYRQISFDVQLQTIDTTTTIDPDNY